MAKTATATEIPPARLKVRYGTELRERLQQELGLENIMQVPRPVKIVVNMGVGDAIREPRQLEVTLRGDRMWEFLDRLLSIALPRIRDFRGLAPKGFDGHGNYTLGLTEQLVFPEVDYDSIVKVRGMDVTLVTTAATDEHGRTLLSALGFPFRSQ